MEKSSPILLIISFLNVMPCAIWYHFYNLKNVISTHGGVLLLVKLQASANIPPLVFFTFLICTNGIKSRKASHILNHSIKFESCDVMMSISTRGGVHFWVHRLNRNSVGHETRPTNRYCHRHFLWKYFAWGLDTKSLFNLVTCHNPSKNNDDEFLIFYSFEDVNWEDQKKVSIY